MMVITHHHRECYWYSFWQTHEKTLYVEAQDGSPSDFAHGRVVTSRDPEHFINTSTLFVLDKGLVAR
jgi:hypothetical protein